MKTLSEGVRERGILFSGRLVRAILAGRKTETRRVIRPQPGEHGLMACGWNGAWGTKTEPNEHGAQGCRCDGINCPYGIPGDRLYVREAWKPWAWHEGNPFVIEYRADGGRRECDTAPHDDAKVAEWEERQWIRISDEMAAAGVEPDEDGLYHSNDPLAWRPSIHMPRWASRINMEITDVRVERVQDICELECYAEGIQNSRLIDPDEECERVIERFHALWDDVNGPRGFGWNANPWVWVVGFRVLTTDGVVEP